MENKKYIITIVVLVLIIIGLGGFIYYDKFHKVKEEKATITKINDTNIDLSALLQVGDTLTKFDKAFSDNGTSFFGYIYQDKLYSKNFDKKAANYLAIYPELEASTTTQYVLGNKVKQNFENIFGTYLKYGEDNVYAGKFNATYTASNDLYSYTMKNKDGIYSPTIITTTLSTSLAKDTIIVRKKMFYVEYGGVENQTATTATIYTSNDKKEQIGTVNLRNGDVDIDEVLAKYSSSLRTYKYTFKDGGLNKYYFYSIERER